MIAAMARGGGSAPMAPSIPAAPVQDTTPAGSLQGVQDVADRILVATPPPGSDRQEVRITLKEGVLPETDIQIVREGNSVSVTFRTENVNANHFLNAHQTDLRERLTERLKVEVSVSLDFQQHDGRSRGQRNLYEEMEDNR
jgi:type III secretion system needle length determinant